MAVEIFDLKLEIKFLTDEVRALEKELNDHVE
jgi:hypothetical protein